MDGQEVVGSGRRSLSRRARQLATLLVALMVLQSVLGLLMSEQYRDVEWIRATWFGNDWLTLLVAAPLLSASTWSAARGSERALLIAAGLAAYGTYNYSFYLFGAALNPFFPLYVLGVVAAALTLVLVASRLDVAALATSFRADTPVRAVGGYLVIVALGLGTIWIGMWAAYAFAGRPTPIEPEAFKIVAALDLCLLVPAQICGGVLLWNRNPWGYFIATVASIQSALYLLVLSVNSGVAIARGLAAAPAELPIWVPLTAATTIAAVVLLRCVSGHVERSND
jgi:hypothetical protein